MSVQSKQALLFFCVIYCQLLSLTVYAHEVIPLKLFVNQLERQESFVLLRDDGDVWVPYEDMRNLNTLLKLDGLTYKQQRYVSLKSHSARLTFKLDSEQLVLYVDINPYYLPATHIDYGANRSLEVESKTAAAFLNYSAIYRGSEEASYAAWEFPLEAVASRNNVSLRLNYSVFPYQGGYRWRRGLGHITADYPEQGKRLLVGDFFASGGELGGSGMFSGIRFSRHTQLDNWLGRGVGLRLEGLLATPSRVDVYANGMLLRSEELPAGPYTLDNIPNVFGGGEAEVVVTDAFGREQRLQEPYYVSSRLLLPGRHEYHYAFGWRRHYADLFVSEYEDRPMLLVSHDVGIRRELTAGIRMDVDKEVINLRAHSVILLSRLGEFELLGGYSLYQQQNAYAALGRYHYVGRRFHVRALLSYTSDAYANLSYKPEQWESRFTQAYSAGLHGLPIGTISLIYNRVQSYSEGDEFASPELVADRENVSVLYNKRLTRATHFFARYSYQFDSASGQNTFMLGVNAIFDRHFTASYRYQQQQDSFAHHYYMQRATPAGQGIGIRARGWTEDTFQVNDQMQGEVGASWNSQHLNTNVSWYRLADRNSYQGTLSGALALVNGKTFLTRPIYDSFGLVQLGKLDDVDVYLSGELMGSTHNGDAIIPNLTSYSRNQIRIDTQSIPVNYSIAHTSKIVVPAYRSGSVIDFELKQFQAVSGHLVFDDFGIKKIPEFALLELRRGELRTESIIGKEGLFYFENLSEGEYQASMLLEGQHCQFQLKVPPSTALVQDLGEVRCVR
ncbi:MAG: fimbria/pilus outer membrane usher protein [Gammaproteobacteria bacterium]|nr:fimbria/pilus outer membrane usher protein [Gammaproteobacteria bacterium]